MVIIRDNSIHGADGAGAEADDTDADNGDNGADADVDLQGQHWQRDSVWWSTGDPGSCIIFFLLLLYSGGHGDNEGNLLNRDRPMANSLTAK